MTSKEYKTSNQILSLFFIIVPTILLVLGYLYYPKSPPDSVKSLIQIPIFLGLVLLLIGFLFDKKDYGKILKIVGWIIFAFYWSTQPLSLYANEGGDIFNGVVCVVGVYVLFYLAYHEWLSYLRKETISCLNWITGASAIAGIIYFGIERIVFGPWNLNFIFTSINIPRINLAEWLIHRVAEQSTWILNTIAGNATVQGSSISLNGHYVVTIIFACTGIQSLVIFVGMIGVIPKIQMKRRFIGLLVTVVPVYILNLFRNAMVAFLVGRNITDFNMAHNIIAKAGSLIALIILLLIVIKIIPEVFDEIISLTDIYKRNGPLEKMFKKIIGRKN
jgi:archaeosortase A